jgi:hypothetical protein
MPGVLDRVLARKGYSGQLADQLEPPGKPGNLFATVAGHDGARGRFESRSRDASWELWTSRHRDIVTAAALVLGAACLVRALGRHRRD